MKFRDVRAQGQPQSRSALLSGAGFVHPVKGLRQVDFRLLRDPRPIVLNQEHAPILCHMNRHENMSFLPDGFPASFFADGSPVPFLPDGFSGVVDQIDQKGTKQIRLQPACPPLATGFKGNVPIPVNRAEMGRHILSDGAGVLKRQPDVPFLCHIDLHEL